MTRLTALRETPALDTRKEGKTVGRVPTGKKRMLRCSSAGSCERYGMPSVASRCSEVACAQDACSGSGRRYRMFQGRLIQLVIIVIKSDHRRPLVGVSHAVLTRSWSHFVGIYRQKLINPMKTDFTKGPAWRVHNLFQNQQISGAVLMGLLCS